MLDTVQKPLSQTLNNVVQLIAETIDYDVSDDAPSTYKELVDHLDSGKRLVVYSGGSNHTIFADAATNHAFRAWHDLTHYRCGYDFSTVGEMFTCNTQISDVIQHFGVEIAEQCLPYLTAEVIGQRLYFEKYKEYIVDQRAFVKAYMISPMTALSRRW